MNFGEFAHGKAQQPLPPSLAPHEMDLHQFATSCHDLCIKLLRLFAVALEVGDAESRARNAPDKA